jgi:hypothetical protein
VITWTSYGLLRQMDAAMEPSRTPRRGEGFLLPEVSLC